MEDKNVLLIGPYIGDWKSEILTFRPFAEWIYNQLDKPVCYMSSHFNRRFLYHWVPDNNFVPVFEHLTRNEANQCNYIHRSITQKDYKLLIKEFKQEIVKREGISVRNITLYNLPYLESSPPVSWYQKFYSKIKIDKIPNDYVIYIPDSSINGDDHKKLLDFLTNNYKNVIMMGDNSCWDIEECINFQIDYSETGYQNLIKYILGCKMVITPCSHWTFLCNLHKIPVMSWGVNGNIYKSTGVFGFDNPNNFILISNEINNILNSIDYFYKKIVRSEK